MHLYILFAWIFDQLYTDEQNKCNIFETMENTWSVSDRFINVAFLLLLSLSLYIYKFFFKLKMFCLYVLSKDAQLLHIYVRIHDTGT